MFPGPLANQSQSETNVLDPFGDETYDENVRIPTNSAAKSVAQRTNVSNAVGNRDGAGGGERHVELSTRAASEDAGAGRSPPPRR